MDIALLLFDLDETLAPDEATDRELFAELGAEIAATARPRFPAGALPDAIEHAAGQLWSAAPTADYCQRIGIHAWEGLWGPFGPSTDLMLAQLHTFVPGYRVAAWSAALAACGIASGGAALAERFLTARRTRQAAYPWSRLVLDALRPRYRLGMITNGAPDLQRLKLAGTGLADEFDPVVISGELGTGKPTPAIFSHALARAGVPASAAIMIGDSWARDIEGALGAGLRAVWLNPRGVPAPAPSHDIVVVPDLRSLPEALVTL